MTPLTPYHLPLQNKLARALWGLVQAVPFRFCPRTAHSWRTLWLRLFGAKIARGCLVYKTARIWAPWNLYMAEGAVIGDCVEIYNVAPVRLGPGAVVSQRAFLCTATHDYRREDFRLIAGAIALDEGAWVAAEAFVAPGVSIGAYAILGARAVATRDVPPHMIATGNPARETGPRPSVTTPPGANLAGIAKFPQGETP